MKKEPGPQKGKHPPSPPPLPTVNGTHWSVGISSMVLEFHSTLHI